MKTEKVGAMGLQVIIVLVVLIGFAIIYLFWLKDFRTAGDNLSDYAICKNSNIENANLKLKIDNLVIQEGKGNRCVTEYLKVPKKQELNFIARKLAGCWDQYLEGTQALFKTEDNTYCVLCSVLELEEDKDLTGLTSYLMENKVPFKKDLSYYEYLSRSIVTNEVLRQVKDAELLGQSGSAGSGSVDPNALPPLNTEPPLAIIFVQGKDINPGSLTGLTSIEGAVLGAEVVVIGGTLVLIGAGLCSTIVGCTVGAGFLLVGGGLLGWFTGSGFDPDTDSRILLWPYVTDVEGEGLGKLECTILEGQDQLLVKTY